MAKRNDAESFHHFFSSSLASATAISRVDADEAVSILDAIEEALVAAWNSGIVEPADVYATATKLGEVRNELREEHTNFELWADTTFTFARVYAATSGNALLLKKFIRRSRLSDKALRLRVESLSESEPIKSILAELQPRTLETVSSAMNRPGFPGEPFS
jgi:DNA-binding GntR family transcriptional regulator